MNYYPMIFNDAMVAAILAGDKTQTRRPIASANSLVDGYPGARVWGDLDFGGAWIDPGPSPAGNPGPYLKTRRPADETRHRVYSRVQPGDFLWVREAWAEGADGYVYRASAPDAAPKWRPSIHMPRRASRILLEVEAVWPERLRDISESDAYYEGVKPVECDVHSQIFKTHKWLYRYRDGFRALWDSIYAARGLGQDADPWVWVYGFGVLDCELDGGRGCR